MTPPLIQLPVSQALPPHALLAHLPADARPHVLEAQAPHGWASPPLAERPRRPGLQLLACEPETLFAGGLAALREARRWLHAQPACDPLAAVVVGCLGYQLGAEIEPTARFPGPAEELPAVELAGFRALYVFDPRAGKGRIVGSDLPALRALREQLEAAAAAHRKQVREGGHLEVRAQAWPGRRPSLPEPVAYRAGVEAIRRWIRAGDVYQVNLSQPLELPGFDRARSRRLFGALAGTAPAPFAAYLETPHRTLVSNSPERFLRLVGDRIETCPIKGTRPRGRSPEEDAWFAKSLRASAKDHAEHLMIVDLERNDLGRVCRLGSVEVGPLARLVRLPTVYHLVSSVRGRLRPGVTCEELVEATFPGGSITGAPKLRAMQIIAELEPTPRDVYTGAIGYMDAQGGLDLSIAIRTARLVDGALRLPVGAGIVAESDPADELAETLDKAEAFARAWNALA